MTDMVALPTLTDAGIAALLQLITSTQVVDDPMQRREQADAILADPALCQPHQSGVMVDRAARFATALDIGDTLLPALQIVGMAGISSPAIIPGIVCLYIDQLVGAKARTPISYFPGMRADRAPIRTYRNGLYVQLRFYLEHLVHGGVSTELLRRCKPHKLGNVLERIAQHAPIIASPGALELVKVMLMDDRGKFSVIKIDGIPHVANDILKAISTEVFTKASRNYDVSAMSASQLLALVPDYTILKPYKARGRKALALKKTA